MGQCLVDHNDWLRPTIIAIREFAACDEPDTHQIEIAGPYIAAMDAHALPAVRHISSDAHFLPTAEGKTERNIPRKAHRPNSG